MMVSSGSGVCPTSHIVHAFPVVARKGGRKIIWEEVTRSPVEVGPSMAGMAMLDEHLSCGSGGGWCYVNPAWM